MRHLNGRPPIVEKNPQVQFSNLPSESEIKPAQTESKPVLMPNITCKVELESGSCIPANSYL